MATSTATRRPTLRRSTSSPPRGTEQHWEDFKTPSARSRAYKRQVLGENPDTPARVGARTALRESGFRLREEGSASGELATRAGRDFADAAGISNLGVGGFLIAATASLIGLAFLDAALRGRGPDAVAKLLGIAGSGLERLFSPVDPLVGRAAASSYASPGIGSIQTSPPAGPAGPTGTGAATTPPGKNTAPFGTLIGGPNAPGSTHDPNEGPDNWQSDNAVDVALPFGSPIFATKAGTISGGFGGGGTGRFAGNRLTVAQPAEDDAQFYTHLSGYAPGIEPGAHVKVGQLIGYSGAANGVNHLHFGRKKGDPRELVPRAYKRPKGRG